MEHEVLSPSGKADDAGSRWKWGQLLQCVLTSDSSFVSVMIPAYTQNRVSALFFILFTLIGKCRWVCVDTRRALTHAPRLASSWNFVSVCLHPITSPPPHPLT